VIEAHAGGAHRHAAPHTGIKNDAIYTNALGAPDGGGPGGIFRLDHDTFEVLGSWEADRGPQQLAYDFCAPGHDGDHWRMGHALHGEGGLNPELLLQASTVTSCTRSTSIPASIARPSTRASNTRWCSNCDRHDPRKAYGFAGVVISLEDLSASI
jgi:selenium-binding protein 1